MRQVQIALILALAVACAAAARYRQQPRYTTIPDYEHKRRNDEGNYSSTINAGTYRNRFRR